MALAKDEGTGAGRGRALDNRGDKGVVLYRSDFDKGFDGWTDHWDNTPAQPWPPLSRTSEICYRGSHCLMLSTGEHASPVSGDISNSAWAAKRFARHDEYRYHTMSAFIAVGIGGFNGTWQNFLLSFDTQKWDNSHRSFFKVNCISGSQPTYSRWQIRGDGGESNYINVPSSNHRTIGDNENKNGMFYVRFTVDLQANSGLGGYQELQVGNQVYDLTGLGGGSSNETPQWDGTNNISDFNGGFNLGIGVSRNQSISGGCQLFADDVVYTASNSL